MSPEPAAHPLATVTWPVRTARLTLHRATPADEEPVWTYRCRPETGRWTGHLPRDHADWHELFPVRMPDLLVIRRDGTVIGDLMVKVEDGWAQREVVERARGVQAELGWVLDPASTGHGYATEAVAALLRICFTDLGLRRVVANAFAANEASWRLMERLGMRRELYSVRESLHRDLGWVDGVGYALLAEEWTDDFRVSPRSTGQ